MLKKKTKVLIVYRSGYSILVDSDTFEITYNGGKITQLRWSDGARPAPLHIGINDVESVWEVPFNWKPHRRR